MIRALAAILLVLPVGAAAADPVDLGPARLVLDDAWTGPAPAGEPVVSIARVAGDAHLVAVRYDVPNVPAWREATRKAHVDAIVAGFARAPGYAVLATKVHRLGPASVPTLDLSFQRRGPGGVEVVAVRVLLFRTTTIAAVAAAPADRAAVERAVAGLTPE